MFFRCYSLSNIPDISKWKIGNNYQIFDNCINLMYL